MSETKSEKIKLKILSTIFIVLLVVCCVLAFNNSGIKSEIGSVFSKKAELDTEADFIKVFDVGEGDSVLLCSNGQSVLIDAGTTEGNNELCKKISSVGLRRLDAVYVTHLHEDHIGGLPKVSDRFKISNIIMPDLIGSTEEYAFAAKSVKNDILNSGGRAYTAKQGMVSYCGDFEITVLGYYYDSKNENDRSIILMVKYNDTKFLFTGDAEKSAEKRLIEDGINFDCDILKVAHHGGRTSTTEEFLKIATPTYAVISSGINNPYYHPNIDVLNRLEDFDAEIHRTDLEGDITFHFYGEEVVVSAERLVSN